MAEFQIELGFSLEHHGRDVDLLEQFAIALEEIAGEMGPSAALEGERYTALLTVEDEEPLAAAKKAADIFVEAMNRALATTGDELEEGAFARYFEHLHIDHAEPALA